MIPAYAATYPLADARDTENGAMAGAMFETFVITEVLKTYSNKGLDYDFDLYYYRQR